jgi:uncharacterized DUF497 family protein
MRIRSLHAHTLDKKLQCKYNIIMVKIRFEWDASKAKTNLLLICHCYREEHGTIRIISARKATRNEAKHYERR